MQNETPWNVGQRVVIGRDTVATVARVTPGGRAIVNGRTFKATGWEYGGGYSGSRLEPLTPSIEAELNLIKTRWGAQQAVSKAIADTERWSRRKFSAWNRFVPEAADIDKAERLIAAIREIIGDSP